MPNKKRSLIIGLIFSLADNFITQYSKRIKDSDESTSEVALNEPRREKTDFLHMRKQRRRSASR